MQHGILADQCCLSYIFIAWTCVQLLRWANISVDAFRSSKESQKAELGAAEARGKADAEKNALQSSLDAAVARGEAEQSSLQAAIQRLEHDAKEYKVPAHTAFATKP